MIGYDIEDGVVLENEQDCSLEDNAYLSENLININIDDSFKKCKLNLEKFQEGVEEVSKLCGGIVALYNVGINPHKAMDYLTDKEATVFISNNSIKMAEINSKATIESSKQQGINIEKQMI